MSIRELKITSIRLDGNTQSRVAIDEDTVEDYAQALTAGDTLPPVIVFHDGVDHWLAEGFHRLLANKRIGAVTIPSEVQQGTLREARLYACGANQHHGLRRTNADKRRAVEIMLDLDPKMSDRAIATHVGVTHTLVAAVRSPQVQERQKASKKTTKGKGVESDSTGSGLQAAEPPSKLAARKPGPVTDGVESDSTAVRAGAAASEQTDDLGMTLDEAIAEVARAEAEARQLRAVLAASEADDLKAEAMKWRRAYEHAQRTADEKMANAARLERELQQLHNRMVRIGKLFGERDPAKIPALVEAFHRQHAREAA